MGDMEKILSLGLMLSLVIIGISGFIVPWGAQYGQTVTDLATLEAINATLEQSDDVRTQLEQTDISTTNPLTLGFAVVRSAIEAVKLLPNSIFIFSGLIADLTTTVPIFPQQFSSILIGFLTVLLIGIFVFAFLKVRP